MGEILIPRRTKVENGYQLLADITVGTATTSVDITGLNIGKGDEVVLVSEIYNPIANNTTYRVFVNSNITLNQYYAQQLQADSTSVAGYRDNFPYITYAETNTKVFSIVPMKVTNSGYFVWQSQSNRKLGTSSMYLHHYYGTTTFTVSSVSTLTINANFTNAIGIGSRFQLYKIGGV